MINFKTGDKVKVLSKSLGKALYHSYIFKVCKKQGYGYVVRTYFGEIEVHYDKAMPCGDFFAPYDLEPYIDLSIPEELFEL